MATAGTNVISWWNLSRFGMRYAYVTPAGCGAPGIQASKSEVECNPEHLAATAQGGTPDKYLVEGHEWICDRVYISPGWS